MLSLALPSRGSAHTQCGHSVLCFIFEVVLMSDSSCLCIPFVREARPLSRLDKVDIGHT